MKLPMVWLGGVMSVFSITLALWIWQRQSWLLEILDPTQPQVVRWSIRCLSIGLLSAAEMTVIALVVGGIYRRSWVDKLFEWSAAGVFGVCLVSALALGLAGR